MTILLFLALHYIFFSPCLHLEFFFFFYFYARDGQEGREGEGGLRSARSIIVFLVFCLGMAFFDTCLDSLLGGSGGAI